MRTLILVLLATHALAGCTTHKHWSAVGGSRSDGIVMLGYNVGSLERPIVDMAQGERLASDRCRAWGYKGASAFGGEMRECAMHNQYGCVRWNVFSEYQCVSSGL